MYQCDFLIIGSGIAGLTYALEIAGKLPESRIVILTKSDPAESNSRFAQGGIAVVWDTENDNREKHIEDTLRAGDGLCKRDVVEMVITEGPGMLNELLKWGVVFDKGSKHSLHLGLEGGHTAHRIVHHKDHTGASVVKTLLANVLRHPNIQLIPFEFATRLLLNGEGNACLGVESVNIHTGDIRQFHSGVTTIASGGAGRVYSHTTNPPIATGDGIAMAFRAGAMIKDMEFVQFHPTALYDIESNNPFLISEAVRGAGAILRNGNGEAFMKKYDARGDLASRDIVARAIYTEMQLSGDDHCYLDCRHLDHAQFTKEFPMITTRCMEKGIDLRMDMIPVVPSAHFICGGIEVNEWGQTSIERLFACGESACTGLHGANRLASNSLLEALVFARRAYLKSIEIYRPDWRLEAFDPTPPPYRWSQTDDVAVQETTTALQALMSSVAGIVRTRAGLQDGIITMLSINTRLHDLMSENKVSKSLLELQNLAIIAELILHHSLQRKKNRGAYFNTDLVAINADDHSMAADVTDNKYDLYHEISDKINIIT